MRPETSALRPLDPLVWFNISHLQRHLLKLVLVTWCGVIVSLRDRRGLSFDDAGRNDLRLAQRFESLREYRARMDVLQSFGEAVDELSTVQYGVV